MKIVRNRHTTWYHSDPPYDVRTAYRPGIPLLRDAIERLAQVTSDPHTVITGALLAHWWFVEDCDTALRQSSWSDLACTVTKTVILVAQFAADVAHLATRNGEGSLHDQYLRACIIAITTAKDALGMPEQRAYFTTATRHGYQGNYAEVAFSNAVASFAWSRDGLGSCAPWHYLADQECARLAILPPGLRATTMQWHLARKRARTEECASATQSIADAIADYWAMVDGEPAMALASVSHAIEARIGVWDRSTRMTTRLVHCSWGSRGSRRGEALCILTVPASYRPGDTCPVRMTDLETNPRACLAAIRDARQHRQDMMAAVRRNITDLQLVNDDWDKALARWERVLNTH